MSSKKSVILGLLVLLPIGIIFFLSTFGENKFNLPVYFAEDSVLTKEGKYKITQAQEIPDFNLIDQDGLPISTKQLKGKTYVADFFFTRCAGICPKMTTQLTRVQEAFLDDSTFNILSFTVDPKNDSAQVLKEYALNFGAKKSTWRFVTGPKDSIYALAQRGFYITAMEDTARPLEFIHSEKLVLVDRNGWIRGYYDGTDGKEVDKLITEIKVLKEIYKEAE